ncbi:hypothetical protein SJAG_01689 [Schizosaccharomyces japonicus yFS275]|uniref:Uncharacterized protein n=1 Tax=Schizosaccharomyces japonicus (strain yFS275 / FY16936) TaxID=402676 RepID=B6JYM4_SCHJY|nr:hypothetical protein SJAG_01689 [Schizosaccharomyces japonicus yFS275]EEB06642.1 hypothetical protein SJAG_01689 [Schizosaccharomyces japonicus yFS275]
MKPITITRFIFSILIFSNVVQAIPELVITEGLIFSVCTIFGYTGANAFDIACTSNTASVPLCIDFILKNVAIGFIGGFAGRAVESGYNFLDAAGIVKHSTKRNDNADPKDINAVEDSDKRRTDLSEIIIDCSDIQELINHLKLECPCKPRSIDSSYTEL